MALISEVNYKAAVALAAAQLTIMYSDTVKTEVAAEIRNPKHPLRRLKNVFLFNPVTGVVTSNDDYITAAYAGNYPTAPAQFDKVADRLPVLVSATVEDAAPADIVLTFDDNITAAQALLLGGAGSTGKTIAGVSIVGAVVTITASADYANAEVIEINGVFYNGLNNLTLTDQAVTNNVT